jgi:vesicle coat complex subunit
MSAEILSSRAMQWASKVSSIADQARGLTLEAAQSVGSRYAATAVSEDARSVDFAKALDARSDREKVDGMRKLLVLTARGEDMSAWFANVVKNVASPSLELRKLVYLYITRYAESQPDLALLSINTIQKALSDQNQLVRALALRVMTSIRVPSISGIALLAIKRCQTDSSFYVRKTAAMALVKTYALDPTLQKQLIDILKVLLADDDAAVFSSAIEAFEILASDKVDLLHPHFRRGCSMLAQMDEFGQISVIRVLERYARICFTCPQATKKDDLSEDFYGDNPVTSPGLSPDLTLLLRSLEALLYSSSAAVVLAVARAIQHLGVPADIGKIAAPLIARVRQPHEIQQVVLANIAVLCLGHATIFSQYAKYFLIYPNDSEALWTLKLEILTLIFNEDNATLVLGELEHHASDDSKNDLSCAAIRSIGICAQRQPTLVKACVDLLFAHLRCTSSSRIAEAVLALRLLIQLDPHAYIESSKHLMRSLDNIHAPEARACIFWLATEQATLLPRVVPDVLRIGVKHFAEEHESVRLQIMVLAVKLYVLDCQNSHQEDVREMIEALATAEEADKQILEAEQAMQDHATVMPDTAGTTMVPGAQGLQSATQVIPATDSRIPQLYAHLMHLCRYDASYDLRDRVRTYKVLASSPSWVLTQKLLFSAKPVPQSPTPSAERSRFLLGSTSMLIGRLLKGYQTLPDWAASVQGADERNVVVQAPAVRQLSQRTSTGATVSGASSRSASPAPDRSNGAPISKPKSKLTGISSLDDFYATSSSASTEEDASVTSTSGADEYEYGSDDQDEDEDTETDSSSDEGSGQDASLSTHR